MDTLFRLVSLRSSSDQHHRQPNSSNSTTTSRSSSKHHHHHHHHHNSYNYHQQQQEQQQYSNYTSYSNYYPEHQHLQADSSYYYPHNSSSSSPQEEENNPAEECCNKPHPTLYMDEDLFSSSSSKAHHFLTTPPSSSPDPNNPNPNSSLFDPPSTDLAITGARWGTDLLLDCARAVAAHDTPRVQQLMWMLNELASPYGDTEQKLASYFLQALFARLTSSGPRTLRSLSSASDRTASFDSTRRTALRFQELSPWSSFGHVAANGAILESFLLDSAASSASTSPSRFHILDLSNTFCTQWPTLLEALATRSADDTPHLTITTVVSSSPSSSAVHRVMKEIGARMEKFARLMGVPFKFNIIHHAGDLSTLDLERIRFYDDGDVALAINCINSLHGVSPVGRRRGGFLSALRRLQPRIVTVVEEEANLVDDGSGGRDNEEVFLKGFRESLRFFSAYFDSLEESFPKTSNERLALERAAGRAVVDLVALPASDSVERRDTAEGWSRRLRASGLTPASFSDDVADDVRALLRRYREGWSMITAAESAAGGDESAAEGIFLAWKEQPVVWASAWRM